MADCHICSAAEAVAVCHQCRRLICEADKIEINGQAYCRLCRAEQFERVDPASGPAVNLLSVKRHAAWRTRYPAIEFAIRFLIVLSYAALVGGVLLALALFILSFTQSVQVRNARLLYSIVCCIAAPLAFLLFQVLSQLLRLLVDIESNTRK